jgi:peptide/nickel transport system permease protein
MTRALVRALPGDPLETLVAETGTTVPREQLARELRLDRPFAQGLLEDLGAALHGDLGRSLLSRREVAPWIRERLAKTAELTALSLALGLAFSLALGLLAARPGRADRFCTVFGAVAAALPTPWIGPMLILAFAVKLPLFPLGGHVALPAITLAIGFTGLWSRLVRARVRETLSLPLAQAARARGLGESRVVLKYGLAPCLGPLAAYFGTQLGAMLGGAMVTEVIFDWPGMGSLLVENVLKRDYPVVEGAVFVTAACCLGGTWLGDWLQGWLDPREGGRT